MKGCFIFKQGTTNVILETPCQGGLYILEPSQYDKPKQALLAKGQQNLKEWHEKTGHPHADRYLQLSYMFDNVPTFSKQEMEQIVCLPCLTGKAKKAPIRSVDNRTTAPLQEIHLDISGAFIPTLGRETYAVHFLEPRTAKSDVTLLKAKSDLGQALMQYKAYAENHFATERYRIQTIRLDQARENVKGVVANFCKKEGIRINPSPDYAPERNGISERIVQEHWTRARILMIASKLPINLWGGALKHANWLRNRLPARRINNGLPILVWSPNSYIDFESQLTFGQPGFGFIYRSKTTASKKLLPRAHYRNFAGMESDTRLIRMYVPTDKRIHVVRRADFRTVKEEKLPSVASLLDGLSRQHSIEFINIDENGQAESHLLHCMTSIYQQQPIIAWTPQRNVVVYDVPSSFAETCQIPEWADAIDREFQALERRQTWTYVLPTPDLNIIKYKGVFRKKPLDGKKFLPKARCVARGDQQEAYVDYDPGGLYALVASHGSLRLILAYAASENIILEGGDISNAYLYGNIDTKIYMEQPTDSSQPKRKPGYVCCLKKSIYGVRQAGNIWGSLVHSELLRWGFQVSKFDCRVYFLRSEFGFVIIAVVVDDISFAASERALLEQVKSKICATFDVKLYGSLRTFIGWNIIQSPTFIKIYQSEYARTLLKTCGMLESNPVRTPLPHDASFGPITDKEELLSSRDHHIYRAVLGGLLYISVCTRPDISFAVGVLAIQMHAPGFRHFKLLKRVLRYLAGTGNLGIHFRKGIPLRSSSLGAAVDADWGGDIHTRRSTTGYIIAVSGSPVLCSSKRQTVIALSFAEAEYVALSECGKTLTWFRKLFWEVCHQHTWHQSITMGPITVVIDSTAAIALAENLHISNRNKHISLKHHHVRELVAMCIILLLHILSSNQPADMLTKSLGAAILYRMVQISSLDTELWD